MQAETITMDEAKSWSYPYQCPLCKDTMQEIVKFPQGVLLQCDKCCYMLNPAITVSTKPDTPSKEKDNEYMAVVRKSMEYIELRPSQKVLDVNSRDGTLLGWYNPTTFTFGVEPNAVLLADSLNKKKLDAGVCGEFTKELVDENSALHGSSNFKIITLVDVIQDSLNPMKVISDAIALLHEEGLLVIQFPYIPELIKAGASKFIYCRNYFLVYVLRGELGNLQMDVQGVEVIGTSVRLYVTRREFKKFALLDYGEKLRLYVGLNSAIVNIELAGRYDLASSYQKLQEMMNPSARRSRNEI